MNEQFLIDVSKLLSSEVGETLVKDVKIDEFAQDDLNAKDIIGQVKLTNLEDRILVDFDLKVNLLTECSRCLKNIKIPVKLNEVAEYTKDFEIDKFQISPDSNIDLMEAIREELIINLPLKPLCSKNCKIENFNY